MEEKDKGERVRIGRLLAVRRNELGLTTREVAERCGLNQSHIVRVEHGRYNVQIDTLAKIAQVLGMEIALVEAK